MYAQQQAPVHSNPSADHSSLDQGASTDLISGAGACEQEAGNQAAVDQAGLDVAPKDDGTFIDALTTMGTLVLDCMPASVAIATARRFLYLDGVREWVDGLDPRQLGQDLGRSANALLAELWPEGTGVVVEGALGGKLGFGADVEGTMKLVRTGKDSIQGEYQDKLDIGLGSMGMGAALKDAFGEQAATAMIKAEMAILGEARGTLETSFSLGALLGAGALELVDQLSASLASPMLSVLATPALAPQVAEDPWRTTWDATISGSGKGTAGLDLDESVLAQLLQQVPSLQQVAPSLAALAQVELGGQVGLRTDEQGFGLHGKGGLKALASIASHLPCLAGLPGLAGLVEASDKGIETGEVEFHLGLRLAGDQLEALEGTSWIRRIAGGTVSNATTGAIATVEDTTTVSLSDFALGLGQGDSGTVAGLLGGGCSAFQREVKVPVDAGAMDAHFPDWANQVARWLGVAPGTQTDSRLDLVGQVAAGAEILGGLAGAGIQAPQGWNGLAAVDAIGQSLVSLRCGGDLAFTWLEPWRAALEAAAARVQVQRARAVGTVRVGVGGAAGVAMGAGVSGEARVNGGIAVDCPLTDEQAALVGRAVADSNRRQAA